MNIVYSVTYMYTEYSITYIWQGRPGVRVGAGWERSMREKGDIVCNTFNNKGLINKIKYKMTQLGNRTKARFKLSFMFYTC